MSETTLWGYKLHVVLELDDGRCIEVLNPLRLNPLRHGVVEIDTTQVLDAINDALTEPGPPKFREVNLSV